MECQYIQENKAAVELDIVNLEFKLAALKAESLVNPSDEELKNEINEVSATLEAKKLSLTDQENAETKDATIKPSSPKILKERGERSFL